MIQHQSIFDRLINDYLILMKDNIFLFLCVPVFLARIQALLQWVQAKNHSGFGLGAGIKRFYMYKYIQHYSKTKKYLEYSNKCTTCIFQGTKHRKQDVYELPLPGDSTRQVLFLQGQGHLSSVYQKSQTCFTRNKNFSETT